MSLADTIAGLTCADVLTALSDYVDGELTDEMRASVEQHVRACSNCERFGGMFAAVIRQLRATAPPTLEERAALERLHARLERER
jgi:anti-sigma factor RsiW